MCANYYRGSGGVVVFLASCVLGRTLAVASVPRPVAACSASPRRLAASQVPGSAVRPAAERPRVQRVVRRSPGAGSFLRHPALSIADFLACVRRDPVLQQRYGRHLGLPWRQVTSYLADHLQPGTIRNTGHYTVYHVTADGFIYPTKQRLVKGTRVYRVRASRLFFTVHGDPGRPFFVPTAGGKESTRHVPPRQPEERLETIHVPSE